MHSSVNDTPASTLYTLEMTTQPTRLGHADAAYDVHRAQRAPTLPLCTPPHVREVLDSGGLTLSCSRATPAQPGVPRIESETERRVGAME